MYQFKLLAAFYLFCALNCSYAHNGVLKGPKLTPTKRQMQVDFPFGE